MKRLLLPLALVSALAACAPQDDQPAQIPMHVVTPDVCVIDAAVAKGKGMDPAVPVRLTPLSYVIDNGEVRVTSSDRTPLRVAVAPPPGQGSTLVDAWAVAPCDASARTATLPADGTLTLPGGGDQPLPQGTAIEVLAVLEAGPSNYYIWTRPARGQSAGLIHTTQWVTR